MKIKPIVIFKLFLAMAVFAACKKSEIPTFSGLPAINFDKIANANSVTYSFMANPDDSFIQEVPVIIMGDTSNKDRTFQVEVVNDSNTTASPSLYEILDGVVEKGQIKGKLLVKLKKSVALDTTTVSLKLKMKDSEDFKAGNIETSEFIIRWTNKVVVPSWSYFRYFFTTAGSTAAYRIIVQTTGLTTLTAQQYGAIGQAGVIAYATKFGDYIKQWNKDHPDDILVHDDGTQKGKEIVPLYYTHSKFD